MFYFVLADIQGTAGGQRYNDTKGERNIHCSSFNC